MVSFSTMNNPNPHENSIYQKKRHAVNIIAKESAMDRILIIAPYGFNDRMTNFIEFVSARLLARRGWEVTAIVGSDDAKSARESVSGITVYRYGNVIRGFRDLWRVLRTSPSIVHVHNLRNSRVGIIGAILAKMFGIRLLCTEYGLLHDHYLVDSRDDPLNHPTHPERVVKSVSQLTLSVLRDPLKVRDYISSYIFHWPLAHADTLVFVSKHNLPIAESLGLPPAVYLPQTSDEFRWVDTRDHASETREKEIAEKVKALKGTSVLFIGQMKLRKGWDVLLRAVPYTDAKDIAAFIFVSSSAESEPKMFSELVDSLGIRERIHFLGTVPSNTLLHEIYEKSSIVAVPSRYEGFGLVPLEAFEMRKPVVASDVVALTEYLVDNENSLLVPPNDPKALAAALSRIARDETLRAKLIVGGAETLKRLRSKEYIEAWIAFYDAQLATYHS